MWAIVQDKNPIWYFDATGGIINNVKGQKKPLLYSLVFHDKENQLILPVSEFFTTANDARTISTYLVQIKLALQNKIPKTKSFQIAPIIVTDFCWGLINAIMTTFNNCSVDTYINWCYEILFNDCSYTVFLANVMKMIFVLCAVHFLKMVTKRVRKIKVY